MEGPEGTADRVVAWLTARIPARLRLLEARLGLPAESLPDPALVVAQERGPLGIEFWPAVYVLPQRLDGLEPVDEVLDNGDRVYRATYALRVLAWVRAEGFEDTDTLRKRYALAIREALLDRLQLAAAPAYGAASPADRGVFAVAPSSIREDYSDVFTDDTARTIAGAWVDVNVHVAETLDGPDPLGTVADAPTVTTTPVTGPIVDVVVHPGLI